MTRTPATPPGRASRPSVGRGTSSRGPARRSPPAPARRRAAGVAPVATSAHSQPRWTVAGTELAGPAVLAGGALALAGEAAVHLQQFAVIFHSVKWVGPLFLANAAACLAVVAGLAFRPTRRLAALAGVGISAIALASLVISYGQGIFGWQEAGWRPAIAWAVI